MQLGTDWQVLFNGPDLVDIDRLSGTAASQMAALKPEIAKLVTALCDVAGVKDATYKIIVLLRTDGAVDPPAFQHAIKGGAVSAARLGRRATDMSFDISGRRTVPL